MRSHLLHLLVYSTLVSAFFALWLKRDRRQQWRTGAWIWLAMVGGTLTLAAIMYPFPR